MRAWSELRAGSRGAVGLVVLLLGLPLGAGCSSMADKVRGDIDDQQYQDAVLRAEDYLRQPRQDGDARQSAERAKVQQLLTEARFGVARQTDSPEAYRAFLAQQEDGPWVARARTELARTQYDTYTRRSDTLQDYAAFLGEFPEGPYAEKAKARSASLAWRQADQQGTRQAYRTFRTVYAGQPQAASALSKELSLAWAEAEQAGELEAFLALRDAYAETALAEPALRRAMQLGEQRALQQQTPEAYLELVRLFAGTPLARRSQETAHTLAWERAAREPSVEGYRRFAELFPDSPRRAEARAAEIGLAWVRAEEKDDEETYRWFVEQYPDAEQVETAEQRALDLAYWASPKGDEHPQARVHQIYDLDPQAVRIHVDVRDRRGTYIAGLSRDDFRVYENGRSAELVDFLGMESNRPVDIVVVIDVSGSMQDKIEAVKQSAIQFSELLRFRQRDSAWGLVTFVEQVEQRFGQGTLTRDVRQFQRWVETVKTANGSRENPVQALQSGLGYKFRKGAQRVVILLTDEAPGVPYDPKSRMTTSDIARLLAQQEVTFYSLTPEDSSFKEMVETTRGVFFDLQSVARFGNFNRLMEHIAALLSLQYQIRYRSPRGIATGEPRTVRVRVSQEKAWVASGRLATNEVLAMFPDEQRPCALLAVTRNGQLWSTEDCGSTFARLEREEFAGIGPLAQAEGSWGEQGTLFLRSERGKLWLLTGRELEVSECQQLPGPVRLLAWSAHAPETLLVVAGDKLHRSLDGGQSFSELYELPTDLAPERLGTVAVDPGAPERVCLLDLTRGLLCRDAATGWELLGLAGAPALPWPVGTRLVFAPWERGAAFLLHPEAGLYRGRSSGGVWRRLALGDATVAPGDGAGAPGLRRYGLTRFGGSARQPQMCQLVGEELYCSRDGGRRWQRVMNGVEGLGTTPPSLAIRPNGEMYLAGGQDGKVYRLFDVANREFVSGSVYFDSDRDEPRAALIPFLEKIGQLLAGDRTLRARVDGHSDADGAEDYNLDLSRRRADKVQAVLQRAGARPEQVQTAGHGETRPLFPNDSEERKQRNRRVEILTLREIEGS